MAFFSYTASTRVPVGRAEAARRGFFARLYAAMLLSRQRTAERELARYLKNNGKLTDQIERDIERSFFAEPSSFDRFS